MLGYLSTDIICSEKRIVLRILSAHCLWRHFGTPSCTHILKTWRVILVPRGRAPFGQHQESQPLTRSKQRKIHGLPVTLRMLKVNSDKSDWFLSQSIVFTKPLIIHAALTRPEHLILVRWMGLETQWKASWKHGRVWNDFKHGMQIFLICILIKQQKHVAINNFVTPPNSNAFSDWRRTRHVPWVKSL